MACGLGRRDLVWGLDHLTGVGSLAGSLLLAGIGLLDLDWDPKALGGLLVVCGVLRLHHHRLVGPGVELHISGFQSVGHLADGGTDGARGLHHDPLDDAGTEANRGQHPGLRGGALSVGLGLLLLIGTRLQGSESRLLCLDLELEDLGHLLGVRCVPGSLLLAGARLLDLGWEPEALD